MSEFAISALVKKRAALGAELARVKLDLAHIDGALRIMGYERPDRIPPAAEIRPPPRFAQGELVTWVGKAERAGCSTNADIARWIVKERCMDLETYQKVRHGVKVCRRRLNRRENAGQ